MWYLITLLLYYHRELKLSQQVKSSSCVIHLLHVFCIESLMLLPLSVPLCIIYDAVPLCCIIYDYDVVNISKECIIAIESFVTQETTSFGHPITIFPQIHSIVELCICIFKEIFLW